jgi:hypothetical protein
MGAGAKDRKEEIGYFGRRAEEIAGVKPLMAQQVAALQEFIKYQFRHAWTTRMGRRLDSALRLVSACTVDFRDLGYTLCSDPEL